MKILLLNGSPRFEGNTEIALKVLKEEIEKNIKGEIETINLSKLQIKGCLGCDYCKTSGGNCITKDDGQMIAEKILESDVIIFGSPVYWWGITSQMKAAIDRIYMKGEFLGGKSKKIGLVTVGAAELSDEEYDIIKRQFKCICEYLKWDFIGNIDVSAYGKGDVLKDTDKVTELKNFWKKI
ncbi:MULTISPECIES: flavodoxin family protein [Fusobacterium]|uniref:flavodoxin family protein n=1 Tax=Fusobacterium TaxID=848 RepID=UPI001476CC0F|nr:MULTISPECIES: flavodoxin family protein [Fusobacterium]NME35699.1 flavodoxin family protein [Fusobacterium sp. FSA-380-WT-3A]